MPIRQPQLFKDIMRFVEKLVVETVKVTEVMRVQLLPFKCGNAFGNLSTFLTHAAKLIIQRPQRKPAQMVWTARTIKGLLYP